jgi:alanyl aminopeptidase
MINYPFRATLLVVVALFAGRPVFAEEAYPRGLLPDGVTPLRYDLELEIDPRQDGFAGRVDIAVTIAKPTRFIWLHGLDLTGVESWVEADGQKVGATYREVDPATGVARLDLDHEISGTATLHFAYRGSYREGSQGLFVIEAGERRYVFSQLQAIDARRVFPGFDQPRFKTPFDITLVTHGDDVAVTNTPLLSSEHAADGHTRHRFATTLPLPTYLLAFAVGPLDVVEAPPIPANEIRSRSLPLRGVATRGQGPRLAFALANTADMVERLERYFGIPFPYPKLDLIATPSLGLSMENAGAIMYDESSLLLDADASPGQLRNFAGDHAHELAHQWFGDLVTPWWWEDTWLNESFATWMGVNIAAEWRPSLFDAADRVTRAFDTMDLDSRAAGRPVREPLDDSRRIASTFDPLTYRKGGGVLSMFESYLGAEKFREGVRLHLARHPHGVATSDEFFKAMADASGQPAVVEAFRGFVEQPGVPLVSATLSAGGDRLALSQSRYRPIGVTYAGSQAWKVPVCVSLYGEGPAEKRCVLLGQEQGELVLPAGTRAVMPNAAGAGYYRFSMDPQALAALVDLAGTLPDAEALALVDSIAAAFRAGRLSFADLVSAARKLAAHRNRSVAMALSEDLVEIKDRWADAPQRAAIAGLLVDIYAPRMAELGLVPAAGAYSNEDTQQRLLRTSLARLLATDAGHEPIVRVLADAARRSLEDPNALDPEFRSIAWAVGVRELGPGFAKEMTSRVLTSESAADRQAAASALGASLDPAASAAALELSMRPAVPVNEMAAIVFLQLRQPESREAAWSWLLPNSGRMRDRLPSLAQDYVFATPSSFCDAKLRESAKGFLDKGVAEKRAGTLRVARTLESIDLCMAQKAALGGQVSELLAK